MRTTNSYNVTIFSKNNPVILDLEEEIENLFYKRHQYPMWPVHGDNPFDEFEKTYHGGYRHLYYKHVLYLIRLLRKLRQL